MTSKQALERAYQWANSTPLRSMSATHAKRLAKEVKKLRDLGAELIEALENTCMVGVSQETFNSTDWQKSAEKSKAVLDKAKGVLND